MILFCVVVYVLGSNLCATLVCLGIWRMCYSIMFIYIYISEIVDFGGILDLCRSYVPQSLIHAWLIMTCLQTYKSCDVGCITMRCDFHVQLMNLGRYWFAPALNSSALFFSIDE